MIGWILSLSQKGKKPGCFTTEFYPLKSLTLTVHLMQRPLILIKLVKIDAVASPRGGCGPADTNEAPDLLTIRWFQQIHCP